MFHVRIERDADRGHKLSAECLGSTGLSQAITRCIALQSQTNDLENLLVCSRCSGSIFVFRVDTLTAIGYDRCLQDRDADIVCWMRQTF